MNDMVTAPGFLRLTDVIRALREAVGVWCGRGILGVVLALLVHRRLGEICRRMERMVARFQAGRLWRIGARAEVAREQGCAGAALPRAGGARIWPRGFAWLVRVAAWEAAGFGSQLRAVLETPEMVALLTAAPQAARVLRPVCRMLGIEAAVLRPGVVAEDVAPTERVRRGAKRREKVFSGGCRCRGG